MTDRTFRVQTGHWHSNDGTRGMSLEILDELSNVPLASLRLTPEQAYDLGRGSTFTVEGSHGELGRVGKTMVNNVLNTPAGLLVNVHHSKLTDVGRAWAVKNFPGWDVYEARRNNSGGVTIVTRKWVS